MAEAGLDTLVSCSNLVDWGSHQGGSGGTTGLDQGITKKNQSKKAKPFECGFCPKRFALKVTCKVHERVHTGEKPFTCKTCSRSFAQMSTLTAHVRIHSGEKPYQCRICLKRFRQRSQLTQHERGVHATSKPFSCDLCDKKFALKSLLKQHLGVHQRRLEQEYRRKFLKPEEQPPEPKKADMNSMHRYGTYPWMKKKPIHSCPQCGRQFNHEGSFRRHERVHTGEQPYQCRVCGRKFADISSLRRHVKKLHPEALAAHTYRAPRVKTEYNYGRSHGDGRVKMEYPYGASAINRGADYSSYGVKPPPPPSPPPPPPPLAMGNMQHFQQFQYGMSPQLQPQFQQQFPSQQYWGSGYANQQGQGTVEANVISVADYPQKFLLCQGPCVEDGRPMVECAGCRHWFHFACVQYLPTAVQPPQQQPGVAGTQAASTPDASQGGDDFGTQAASTPDASQSGDGFGTSPAGESSTEQSSESSSHPSMSPSQPQPIPSYSMGQAPFYCQNCRFYQSQHMPQPELALGASSAMPHPGAGVHGGEHDVMNVGTDPNRAAQMSSQAMPGAPGQAVMPHVDPMLGQSTMLADQGHITKTEIINAPSSPPPPPPPSDDSSPPPPPPPMGDGMESLSTASISPHPSLGGTIPPSVELVGAVVPDSHDPRPDRAQPSHGHGHGGVDVGASNAHQTQHNPDIKHHATTHQESQQMDQTRQIPKDSY